MSVSQGAASQMEKDVFQGWVVDTDAGERDGAAGQFLNGRVDIFGMDDNAVAMSCPGRRQVIACIGKNRFRQTDG